ncbi:MAG: FAD-binding oxidoreductase [Pseudomonadota bacterium]
MDGPLDPAMYDTGRPVPSWWEASAGPGIERPTLAGEHRTEVAIIGGGYTGLSAAIVLAEQGIGCTVLDAGAIGWGSSGRNGGIVGFGGSKLSRTTMVRRYGAEETARSEEMLATSAKRIHAFCLEHGLAADTQGDGELILAHGDRSARELAGNPPPSGFRTEPIAPSGRPDIARFGGVRLSPGFGIHPLRYVRALAEAADAAGTKLHPRSEVLSWERDGNGHRLITAGGAVLADRVMLATNGFTPDRLHPTFRARIAPVLSNIVVTRPLTESERQAHPWLTDAPVADTRNLLAYFRCLPDGRLLFGMRGDVRGSDRAAERMHARLRRRIARELPGVAAAETTHFWRGPVCANAALRPSIGRLEEEPTVFHAYGWHGSGINMGSLAGRLTGALVAGADPETIPAPWRGLTPRIPLPGLRPLYVGASMLAYALADRQG